MRDCGPSFDRLRPVGRHSAAEEEGSDLLGMREPRRPDDAERGQLLLARGRHAVPDTAESAAQPEQISDTTSDVDAEETLEITLAPAGGYAAALTPRP